MNVKGNTPKCKQNAAMAIKSIGIQLLSSALIPKTYRIWVIVMPARDANSKYYKLELSIGRSTFFEYFLFLPFFRRSQLMPSIEESRQSGKSQSEFGMFVD